MGGLITIAIKDTDGKIYHGVDHTNDMPYQIQNVKMFEHDKNHIEKYINEWDQDENPTCSPNGYGLVAIDHVKKTVLSMQGYCAFDTINSSSIFYDLETKNTLGIDRMQEFFDRGYIKNRGDFQTNQNNESSYVKSLENNSFYQIVQDHKKPSSIMRQWYLDGEKNQWKFLVFEENEEGSNRMLDYMIKNFSLSEGDIEAWKQYSLEYFEEED